MNRLGILIAVVAAACAAASSTSASNQRLLQVGSARFPDREFVLSLPHGERVAPDRVRVFENGQAVSNLSVVPAGSAGRRAFGVVLAIDASNSMRGAPLASARAAARAFVAERNSNQAIAVVFFNARARVGLPFTADSERIAYALSRPVRTAAGTHIYDAVQASADLLRRAHIVSGSIVILSDGSDTGSRTTAAGASAAAKSVRARVYSIGLRSRSFRPGTLQQLSARTQGEYAQARSASDLSAIYHSIGTGLANEYLIRYRSPAGVGQRVHVTAAIADSSTAATASYVAPRLEVAPASGFHRPFSTAFWQSPVAIVLVAAAVGALVAFVLGRLLRGRRSSLRARVGEFVTIRPAEPAGEGVDSGLLTGRVLAGAERSFQGTRWWAQFKLQVELAELPVSSIHLAALTIVATLLLALVLGAAAGPFAAAFALATPLLVRTFVRMKVKRRRDRFAEQLPDNLQVIASALRAGHSLVGALAVLTDDAPEPAHSEFRRVLADEQLGVPLEDALSAVGRRMGNTDLEQIALVAALQRQTGGNSAEVIDRVTETIRQRFELRRLVKTLTTQGRMARWVVSLLPVVLFFVINLINPTYMRPLFERSGGRVLVVFAALMVVTGSYVIKRIVDIKV
jgi:tight adherence protein B